MKEMKMIDELLLLLPYWHYQIERPLKQLQKKMKISFETYYCLRLLSHNKTMCLTELAACLHMSKQQITKIVNTLCKYEFLKRSRDELDHRITKVTITPIALQYINKEAKLNEQYLAIMSKQFSKEELFLLEQNIKSLLILLRNKGTTSKEN